MSELSKIQVIMQKVTGSSGIVAVSRREKEISHVIMLLLRPTRVEQNQSKQKF